MYSIVGWPLCLILRISTSASRFWKSSSNLALNSAGRGQCCLALVLLHHGIGSPILLLSPSSSFSQPGPWLSHWGILHHDHLWAHTCFRKNASLFRFIPWIHLAQGIPSPSSVGRRQSTPALRSVGNPVKTPGQSPGTSSLNLLQLCVVWIRKAQYAYTYKSIGMVGQWLECSTTS